MDADRDFHGSGIPDFAGGDVPRAPNLKFGRLFGSRQVLKSAGSPALKEDNGSILEW